MTHGLGAKPHKPDPRDWKYRDVKPMVGLGTRRFYAMHGSDFRMDQGREGTCVGHGATNILLANPKPHYTFPSFDTVGHAHQFARELYLDITNDATYSHGAYVRDACDELRARRQIVAYYRLISADEVVTALLNTAPVLFASPWYYGMFDTHGPDGMNLWVNPDSGLAGYHCYALTAVDLQPIDESEPYVRMENSWGPGWGKNGTARIKVDDLPILYDGDAYVLTEATF